MSAGPGPSEAASAPSEAAPAPSEAAIESLPELLTSAKRPSSPSPQPRLKVPSWVTGLQQEIDRSRASLRFSEEPESNENLAFYVGISGRLSAAEDTLQHYAERNWLVRLVSAGAVYEEVLAMVQVASEDLLLIEDDALVEATIPSLRAGIKAYLGASDPRFDEYTQLIDRLARSSEKSQGKDSRS